MPSTHLVGRTTQWEGRGDHRTDIHTRDTDGHPAGAVRRFPTLCPPHQPLPGTVAGTQNGYALDTGCCSHGQYIPHHMAHTGPQHGSLRAQTLDDTDRKLDLKAQRHGTESEAPHRQAANRVNTMRGMHRPREGQGPAYSIFKGHNAPRPEGAGAPARLANRPKPAPKAALPLREPKPNPHICPFFSLEERNAMKP